MENLLNFLADNSVSLITLFLGAFFVVAFIVKGIRERRHRQIRESTVAAIANGGTPESPVHIGDPFSEQQQPTAPAEAGGNIPPKENEIYVWE